MNGGNVLKLDFCSFDLRIKCRTKRSIKNVRNISMQRVGVCVPWSGIIMIILQRQAFVNVSFKKCFAS